ncbi:phytanoyl-CoA dioxygenase family protein [Mycolicibacterium vinylchloridicum]|uniref:hypothetical protein n=1 Tax=Mycolicibacterium vinylchloridicum TaxID=2736928 RepID=UPI0015CACDF6|nr:hypothetical protein [Mycolicibacterium vinylchloridicum]
MAGLREFDCAEVLESAPAMRQALDEDGIFVVRNVLSAEEVGQLRGILRQHLTGSGVRLSLGRTQPNAAAKVPALSFIFAHPQIVQVITQVLGESNVVFTGHCDIHMNMLSGWHKDSGETVPGGYFTGPYMTSPDCRVYKVAIYLQDTGPRDGFTARLGSHRYTDLTTGEKLTARSHIGDIVVFDVRITHTGQLPDPVEKGLKGLSRVLNKGQRDKQDPQWVSRLKAAYWKAIGRRDRLSVFFTYGAPNSFTYDFAEANMTRQARQGADAGSTGLPPRLREALENEGVSLCDASSK